jgi:hypothetical protein
MKLLSADAIHLSLVATTSHGARRQLTADVPAPLWAVAAGGSANAAAAQADGSTLVTGYFWRRASFGTAGNLTSAGNSDGFVGKLTPSGDWAWVSQFGGAGQDQGSSIVAQADGSSIVSGSFRGTASFGAAGPLSTLTAAGYVDGFVGKVTPSGDWLWVTRFGGPGVTQFGLIESGFGIAQAHEFPLVTGTFRDTASFGAAGNLTSAGGADGFVGKLAPTGNWVWVSRFGGTGDDVSYGIAAQADGSSIVTGNFQGTASFGAAGNLTCGQLDGFVGKLMSNGAWAWVAQFGGPGSDGGYGIAAQADGSSIVTGYFSASWKPATFGTVGTLTSAGDSDGFVGKLTPSGDWAWVSQFGGAGKDQGRSIVAQADGSSIVSGYFQGTASFGAAGSLTSAGHDDIFVAKVGAGGAIVSVARLGGTGSDRSFGVASHASGTATVVGKLGADSTTIAGTTIIGSESSTPGGFASDVGFPCAAGQRSVAAGGVGPCIACPAGQHQPATSAAACLAITSAPTAAPTPPTAAPTATPTAAPTPAPPTPKPTPKPTVAGAPPPITVANVLTGFTKDTFSAEYQLAFRTAAATTLNLATAKVTLGPVTDVARRRLLLDRTLAETTSIAFDTIITLTKADVDATPTLFGSVEHRAAFMAAEPTALITAFATEQQTGGITAVTPTITSALALYTCVAGQCKVMLGLGGMAKAACSATCQPSPEPASDPSPEPASGLPFGLGLGLGLPAAAAIVALSLRRKRSGAAAGAGKQGDAAMAGVAAAPEIEMMANPMDIDAGNTL